MYWYVQFWHFSYRLVSRRGCTGIYQYVPPCTAPYQGYRIPDVQRYKSTTAGNLNLLYSLFFLLYWLFHMSDQLWASCNLDLWTAGVCSTNLHDSLSPVIKKTPCMAATTAQSVLIDTYYTHYFTIISIICTIIRIISNLKIQIWVHIHCRKRARRHIHNWGSVRKQNHCRKDSNINQ